MPALKSLIICSSVVFVCVCLECGNFQIQPPISNLPEVSRTEVPRFPAANMESALMNFSSSNISFTKPFITDQEVRKTTELMSKELTEFALEGGGIGIGFPPQNSSVKSEDDAIDEEFHNKGSKGRKGVKFPGSSVVPRKGVSVSVDQLVDIIHSNTTNTPVTSFSNNSLVNNNTNTVIDSKAPLSINNELSNHQAKVQMQEKPIATLNATHSKKPEYVSDEKDGDDFDKYSIIKTSTTGEDYVIIGIVIVIGIWLSVFGALIFYRRAGEYWDRRHYRRMDFLVEGMYND